MMSYLKILNISTFFNKNNTKTWIKIFATEDLKYQRNKKNVKKTITV